MRFITANARRVIPLLTLTAVLACISVHAAESDRRFLRSVGSITQSNTVVTAAAGTNAYPDITVTWRSGDITDTASKPMTHAGWFAFVEQPTRIWVFDGDALSLLEKHDRTVSDSSSAEAFKNCPKEVKDALPEKIRRTYFK